MSFFLRDFISFVKNFGFYFFSIICCKFRKKLLMRRELNIVKRDRLFSPFVLFKTRLKQSVLGGDYYVLVRGQ